MASTFLIGALLGCSASMVAAFAPGLEVAYSLDLATQAISISPDGRVFLAQRYSLTEPTQIVELLSDNTTVLYPDTAWNSYNSSLGNVNSTFVNIDGSRLGPDGRYWVVDGGAQSNGAIVSGSAKLVAVNLTTNAVDKIYPLDDIIASTSGIDDVRFNGDVAYLSDTAGALLVLDLLTGSGVRVLADDASAGAWFPMAYNGTLLPGYGAAGSTLSVGLDQIEVSPDGVYLYYQGCSGGMYRIETRYVDAALTNATLAASLGDYAEAYTFTPSTGGTTIDGDGNIYVSDTNLLAIWKIDATGRATILVQDDALVWTDQMFVGSDLKLYLPASQMRPGADGLMAASPNYIFSYYIGVGPSLIDHP